jgi:hypothetical protein
MVIPWREGRAGWAALNGDVVYSTDWDPSAYKPTYFPSGVPLDLFTAGYGKDFSKQARIDTLPLPLLSVAKGREPSPRLYFWKDRLYLIGHTLITVDVSNRKKPRLISSTPLGYPERGDSQKTEYMADADTLVVELPNVPGLPPAQRLDFAAARWDSWWKSAFDGEVFCQFEDQELQEFRLSELTSSRAIFKLVGSVRPGLIDYIFGYAYSYRAQLQNGLLYVSQGYSQGNFNPRVSVYQTRGPGAPRMIAHFASPGWSMVAAPLPDGRAVIVGKKIWLVGPPPNRD